VCGDANGLQVDAWRAAVRLQGALGGGGVGEGGAAGDETVVEWFWEAVGDLAPEQQRLLLQFWSGSDSVPIEVGRGGVVACTLQRLQVAPRLCCRVRSTHHLQTKLHPQNTKPGSRELGATLPPAPGRTLPWRQWQQQRRRRRR